MQLYCCGFTKMNFFIVRFLMIVTANFRIPIFQTRFQWLLLKMSTKKGKDIYHFLESQVLQQFLSVPFGRYFGLCIPFRICCTPVDNCISFLQILQKEEDFTLSETWFIITQCSYHLLLLRNRICFIFIQVTFCLHRSFLLYHLYFFTNVLKTGP